MSNEKGTEAAAATGGITPSLRTAKGDGRQFAVAIRPSTPTARVQAVPFPSRSTESGDIAVHGKPQLLPSSVGGLIGAIQ